MTLHIEGMGVLGCYIALRLEQDGIDFTWSDTRDNVNSWRACTGAIFPSGHEDDERARMVWFEHLRQEGFAEHMEQAHYVFSTKAPPHGGRYEFEPLGGEVKLASEHSLHLNAQAWVPATRKRFHRHEWWRTGKPGPERTVRAHGFGPRLSRYMWGWTVPVKVGYDSEFEFRGRCCMYFRQGRFTMAYAYPIPGTEWWYAGSSLISQRVPNSLEVAAKYKRWRHDFLRLGFGFVKGVAPAGTYIEGWRPVPAESDPELVTRDPDGALAVKPLWHSGVRQAPLIYDALWEEL